MRDIRDVLALSIEGRGDYLFGLEPGDLTDDMAAQVVKADLAWLKAEMEREGPDVHLGLSFMGGGWQRHPSYAAALEAANPRVAQMVEEAVAEDDQRVLAKEARKAAEMKRLGVIEHDVTRKCDHMLEGLTALATKNGYVVYPDQVTLFPPGHVPTQIIENGALKPHQIETLFEVANSAQRLGLPMACLEDGTDFSPTFVVQDGEMDLSQVKEKGVILYGRGETPMAVVVEPEILRSELGRVVALEAAHRQLAEQAEKVDRLTTELLSYAANSQVPPPEWLHTFEQERAKLAKIAGWEVAHRQGPQAEQAEGASYGTIRVWAEDSSKALLNALGVSVAGYDPAGKFFLCKVPDSVWGNLQPYRGEYNWDLRGISAELASQVLSDEPLHDLDFDDLVAAKRLLMFEAAEVKDAGGDPSWLVSRQAEVQELQNQARTSLVPPEAKKAPAVSVDADLAP